VTTTEESSNGFAAQVWGATDTFQRAVVANVELATRWTELVTAFLGAKGAQAATTDAVTHVLQDNTETVVDLAADVSVAAEQTAGTTNDEVDEQEVQRSVEADRAEAKHADLLAREPYLGLTKAELSALLAERGLPKTGTINTLVERLVSSDAQ
jgi:hypothetical protein